MKSDKADVILLGAAAAVIALVVAYSFMGNETEKGKKRSREEDGGRRNVVQRLENVEESLETTEEQLNEEALNAAFDELREVAMRYLEITQQQTVEIFTQITPEQRVHAMSFMRERRDPDQSRDPGADDDR